MYLYIMHFVQNAQEFSTKLCEKIGKRHDILMQTLNVNVNTLSVNFRKTETENINRNAISPLTITKKCGIITKVR